MSVSTTPVISLIRGDGIGPEISEAVVKMLAAAAPSFRMKNCRRAKARLGFTKTRCPKSPSSRSAKQSRAQGSAVDAKGLGLSFGERRFAATL